MRILCLSNFYPPASRGGYELWCQEVTEGLRGLGHEVMVLTSTHGQDAIRGHEPAWVRRDLHLEMEFASLRNSVSFFASRRAREDENLACLRLSVARFSPDVVLVWGMWNLPRSLPALAEKLLPARVAYYIGDYWPTLPCQLEVYWQAPARNWLTGIPKTMLKPLALGQLRREPPPRLAFEHAIFPTIFMRDELKRGGVSPMHSEVVYGAIDTYPFRDRHVVSDTCQGSATRLLFVGRLTPEKGVHTAIEALHHLLFAWGFKHVQLTIVGSGEPDYEAHLRRLASEKKVESAVAFLRAQPQEAMPAIYQQADILLFTSIWPEPFGRVLVEAMASGLAVVGATTGGATEILNDNVNALTYAPGDPYSLAAQVARLIESPQLRKRLAESARCTSVQMFDIHRMTAQLEAILKAIVQAPA